jgi:orotidine-5'-phosphate decarboxylase
LRGRPQIWGVTVLTSLTGEDMAEIGFQRSPMEQAERLAGIAMRSNIDGIVASVGETSILRNLLGPKFTIVTPGIRLPENSLGDQKRVATPANARAAGATYIVVGRPIIEAKDPSAMAEQIMKDWKK